MGEVYLTAKGLAVIWNSVAIHYNYADLDEWLYDCIHLYPDME
tara:strand:+ start:195 stop:323 length:129 start_codon:yes stop_codon:yes gene_type:complete